MPFYPTMQKVEYKRLELKNIATMTPIWGDRLNSEKYKTLYKLLSTSGRVKFYGLHRDKSVISEGYMGKLPFDGISVIQALQKHGIVLIIHSEKHFQFAIPSSRIFEAAAASAVVICDENPFVKKHFNDSVYYVDTSKTGEEIYAQIIQHIDHIALHPEAALSKAEQAHQIFIDKFLMTEQLLQLESLHNRNINLCKN